MDLVDIIEEKKFIGNDFITWLWMKNDNGENTIQLESEGEVVVSLNGKIRLENQTNNVACSGHNPDLKEAMVGLLQGKKPVQVGLSVEHQGENYSLIFVSSTFEFKSISTPRVANDVDGEGNAGLILERIFLFDRIFSIFSELLKAFINRGPEDEEKMRAWAKVNSSL